MTSLEQAREVIRWCRQLAKFSEDRNAITRTFLSKPMRDVHTALAAWMARVGMTVRVDAIGNIRGVYPPRLSPVPVAASPRFYIGSHLDTVPNAGAFDGVLGTVLAIALVELLEERRFPFAIEVVGFSDEEGVRFGVPFLGSRALAGTFDTALLDRTRRSRPLAARRDHGISASIPTVFLTRRRQPTPSAISSSTSSRDPSSRTSTFRSPSSMSFPVKAGQN